MSARELFSIRTSPCPRCNSLNTRATGVFTKDGKREVLVRQCLSCKKTWDYIPEFAPRRRRRALVDWHKLTK
jgi:hypothetical protein